MTTAALTSDDDQPGASSSTFQSAWRISDDRSAFQLSGKATHSQAPAPGSRSHQACYTCRLRHIKCDETYPVCLRCRKRDLVCMPKVPAPVWQMEMPWLQTARFNHTPALNPRLLRYWIEKASQQWTISPDQNPFSSAVLEQLQGNESLLHTVQCISAAHEIYFNPNNLSASLEERSKALVKHRLELQDCRNISAQSFLTAYLLGISCSWIEHSPDQFGQEHFMGARIIFEGLLSIPDFDLTKPFNLFFVGAFVYWDMACSLLVDPENQRPLETSALQAAVKSMGQILHPLTNYATEMFYELARLGRYCRRVIGGWPRDENLEFYLEHHLTCTPTPPTPPKSQTVQYLNDTFRLAGLILLYRICKRPHVPQPDETDRLTRNYAHSLIDNVHQIAVKTPAFRFIGLPLLVAGAELTKDDANLREQVLSWYTVLISVNRLPNYVWATELLHDLWERNDRGDTQITWLHLMLEKNWRLDLS